MKKPALSLNALILFIFCSVFTASAAEFALPDVRNAPIGSEVTVIGYAFSATDTPGTGFEGEFYLNNLKAQGICVSLSESTPNSLYKEYSVTGTLTETNGEIKITDAVVTALSGTEGTRKTKKLNSSDASDYESNGGTFARVIGTVSSPVTENGVLKSFTLTDDYGSIRVVIPDNVLSLSDGANGKAVLTEKLQYKLTVNVDGFIARNGSEVYIRIKDCDDIDVQEHTCLFSDEVIEKEATCEVDGLAVKECICGRREERVIPALTHDFYTADEKAVTCTEDGLKAKLCRNCSFREETIIAKTGHNYKERTETEAT